MIAVLTASLSAQDTGAAMLRSNGGVLLNGNPAPASSAIFPDDLIQTQPKAEATINATGSTASIQPDTVVQFAGAALNLDHGTVLVTTSNAMSVRVGCITVTPATAEWTQYDVTDTDGKVIVNAHKNDVNIDDAGAKSPQARPLGHSERVTVREGNQASREEKCAVSAKPPGYVAGKGAILNSAWVKWPSVVAIGVGTCWVICRGDDPVSPSRP